MPERVLHKLLGCEAVRGRRRRWPRDVAVEARAGVDWPLAEDAGSQVVARQLSDDRGAPAREDVELCRDEPLAGTDDGEPGEVPGVEIAPQRHPGRGDLLPLGRPVVGDREAAELGAGGSRSQVARQNPGERQPRGAGVPAGNAPALEVAVLEAVAKSPAGSSRWRTRRRPTAVAADRGDGRSSIGSRLTAVPSAGGRLTEECRARHRGARASSRRVRDGPGAARW